LVLEFFNDFLKEKEGRFTFIRGGTLINFLGSEGEAYLKGGAN